MTETIKLTKPQQRDLQRLADSNRVIHIGRGSYDVNPTTISTLERLGLVRYDRSMTGAEITDAGRAWLAAQSTPVTLPPSDDDERYPSALRRAVQLGRMAGLTFPAHELEAVSDSAPAVEADEPDYDTVDPNTLSQYEFSLWLSHRSEKNAPAVGVDKLTYAELDSLTDIMSDDAHKMQLSHDALERNCRTLTAENAALTARVAALMDALLPFAGAGLPPTEIHPLGVNFGLCWIPARIFREATALVLELNPTQFDDDDPTPLTPDDWHGWYVRRFAVGPSHAANEWGIPNSDGLPTLVDIHGPFANFFDADECVNVLDADDDPTPPTDTAPAVDAPPAIGGGDMAFDLRDDEPYPEYNRAHIEDEILGKLPAPAVPSAIERYIAAKDLVAGDEIKRGSTWLTVVRGEAKRAPYYDILANDMTISNEALRLKRVQTMANETWQTRRKVA